MARQYFDLAEKAVARLAKSKVIGFKEFDSLVQYVLDLAEKTHSKCGLSGTADRIIDMLVNDDALLLRCYDDVAPFVKELHGNEEKARVVLEKAYQALLKDMGRKKPFSIIDENETIVIGKPNASSFTKLGFIVVDVLGDSKFALEVVTQSEKHIESFDFDDFIELGYFYTRIPKDEKKACLYYRKAETLAFSFSDLQMLSHHVSLLPSHNTWTKNLIDKCLCAMDKNKAEDWCDIAMVASRIDRKLSKEMFKQGLSVAKSDFERKSVKDSQEMMEDAWEEEERGYSYDD